MAQPSPSPSAQTSPGMRWGSALGTDSDLADALATADASLAAQLDGRTPDLLFVFVSPHYAEAIDRLPSLVAARWPGALLCGCTAGGVVGGGHELEGARAIAVTAASLPGVTLHPVHLGAREMATLLASPLSLPRMLGTDEEALSFVLLGDPFSCDMERLAQALDIVWPGTPKVGGLASGARSAGQGALLLGDSVHRAGAVLLGLSGAVRVDTVVAQGCRPVGTPMRITRCDGNMLLELDSEPAAKRIQAIYQDLSEADQVLMRSSLFMGVVIDDANEAPGRGDFLVRNILGSDPRIGALAIGGRILQHQLVQLHVRDARTSAEDLSALLSGAASADAPRGALMFSCLGRGEGLYGEKDHDVRLIQERFEALPVGGFFCNGEVGPVGGSTFLHGYTSSIALFRD